ncbi:hypothetical protein FE784_36685 [Paenibacillus hemerocallicola]|uniref:Uncharacterized protein n=1 Tax=Paenibacillus hemerocallicola TaxID=1172614 RepID=A0A5C4SXN1_9BACL|nr:hypothetical protein [Paenibacillus hemerocallicola]TNJ60023.1 hypothetical protein FE784_36685 [Paenibacillus hemerocallicola]
MHKPSAADWLEPAGIRFGQAEENELTAKCYAMLLRWIPFADSRYEEWERMPECGYFFGGSSWYGVDTARSITVYAALSVLGSYDERIAGCSRERLMRRAISGIRYLAFTHDSGPEHLVRVKGSNPYCSERKWGGQGDSYFMATQTGYSVYSIALASWLLWERLDEETRSLVRNVLFHYADRWCDAEPRDGVYGDTQAEENSWVAQGVAAAADMFPDHPRSGHWRRRFRKWAANSVTVSRDRYRADFQAHTERTHGVPVPFISTSTLHPDYTTENHGFVHPTYLALGINQRASHALFSLMSGTPAEPFALMNNGELYDRVIKKCCQSDGFMIPVQGQDWWYNRQHELAHAHAVLNVLHGNRDAARFERLALKRIGQIQSGNANGCFLEREGKACVIREGTQTVEDFENWAAQDVLHVYLLHAFGGPGVEPSDETEMSERLSGVSLFPYGGFVVRRTRNAFASFSWRNNIMGVCLGKDGIWLTTPVHASMTGTIRIAGHDGMAGWSNEDVVRDAEHASLEPRADGFGATVLIRRGGGELEQDAAFVALPDGRCVYAERLRAIRDCTIDDCRTGIVGVRNDKYPDVPESAEGTRALLLPGMLLTFEGFAGDASDEEQRLPAFPYVNVDDKMGYVLFGSGGIRYINKHRYKRWKGVENTLALNDAGRMSLKAGEARPCFAVVALPNRTMEQTAEAAERSMLLSDPTAPCLLLECGETIVFANFAFDHTAVCGERELAGAEVGLFEGVSRIRGSRISRSLDVEARKSGFAAQRLKLALTPFRYPYGASSDSTDTDYIAHDRAVTDEAALEGLALDVIVRENAVYVMNGGERPVDLRLSDERANVVRSIRVCAASFKELPLPLQAVERGRPPV